MKVLYFFVVCGLIGVVIPDFYISLKAGETIRYVVDILLLIVLFGVFLFLLKKRKEEIKEK